MRRREVLLRMSPRAVDEGYVRWRRQQGVPDVAKVFVMTGWYPDVKRALKERGWFMVRAARGETTRCVEHGVATVIPC